MCGYITHVPRSQCEFLWVKKKLLTRKRKGFFRTGVRCTPVARSGVIHRVWEFSEHPGPMQKVKGGGVHSYYWRDDIESTSANYAYHDAVAVGVFAFGAPSLPARRFFAEGTTPKNLEVYSEAIWIPDADKSGRKTIRLDMFTNGTTMDEVIAEFKRGRK